MLNRKGRHYPSGPDETLVNLSIFGDVPDGDVVPPETPRRLPSPTPSSCDYRDLESDSGRRSERGGSAETGKVTYRDP